MGELRLTRGSPIGLGRCPQNLGHIRFEVDVVSLHDSMTISRQWLEV